ncbi:3'-5' exonuclease [uncultured Helicobacter sp.]|uniref:3'-5' exonuclease n=1 Tax=uncultured Helicobacter sp. TaxID=175537 RepID=UPI00261624F7|nr:3'-5' exonuclease [uncultured Helicobacter sp.]
MICVFDIESVPDFHLLRDSFGFEGSPLQIAQSAAEEQYAKNGSSFLSLCFHRVISIGSVICDDFGRFVKVGHFGTHFLESLPHSLDSIDFLSSDFLDTLEKTLLNEFWTFFNKNNPRLVSFNGRGFDIPTMLLRAMRYDINAWAYYEQDNPTHNKSKWENYRQRYSEVFHTDLLDSLGNFGVVRSLKLDNICKMLGLVGKYDMSGEQVFDTYINAQSAKDKLTALETINHYCHSDVLNTYWLYLKYELLKGHIIESDYYHILQEFLANFPANKPYSQVFKDTLERHITKYTQDSTKDSDG